MELNLKAIFGIIAVITIIGTGSIYYFASMNKPVWLVTVEISGNGRVNLGSFGPYTTLVQVNDGQTLLITAQPDDGWKFIQWSGDLSGTFNPMSIVVTRDLRITATFIR